MKDPYALQASEDFSRARGRALLSRIQHILDGEKNKLLSFHDIRELLKPRSETYQGMKTVPIDLIVGSEGRYRDFTKYFLPASDRLKSRWVRVDEAHIRDIILPPIQLYEIGGVYFVRDGNHRVSVARSQGSAFIDAEVVSLFSEIPFPAQMTVEELRRRLIAREKAVFYEKARFAALTGCSTLDFTSPGRYDEIEEHILVHKYYLNQEKSEEIPYPEALRSWYSQVYEPIIRIIAEERLCLHFPGRTSGDLYLWIAGHWDALKRQYGIDYTAFAAAKDFSQRYGKKPGDLLSRAVAFLRGLLRCFRPLLHGLRRRSRA